MTFFGHAQEDAQPIDVSLGTTFQSGYQGDPKAQYQIGMHYLNGVDRGNHPHTVYHDECPKNRIKSDRYGNLGLNYLCEGWQQIFHHIDPIITHILSINGLEVSANR